jgi:hypothetical protein
MRITHFVCWLSLPVGALLCGLSGAAAEPVDVRQACTPDAMRLCSDVIPDIPKVTACMHAKRRQLSQECRTAMAAGQGGHRHSHGHHTKHSKHQNG